MRSFNRKFSLFLMSLAFVSFVSCRGRDFNDPSKTTSTGPQIGATDEVGEIQIQCKINSDFEVNVSAWPSFRTFPSPEKHWLYAEFLNVTSGETTLQSFSNFQESPAFGLKKTFSTGGPKLIGVRVLIKNQGKTFAEYPKGAGVDVPAYVFVYLPKVCK